MGRVPRRNIYHFILRQPRNLFLFLFRFISQWELLLERLGGYKYKKGPMGSTKPKELFDEKEVPTLLSRHRSELASIWQRDVLAEWSQSLNMNVKAYAPTEGIQRDVDKIVLPGDQCDTCKSQRKKCAGAHEHFLTSYCFSVSFPFKYSKCVF